MYTKEEARSAILAEWATLPAPARKTGAQAAMFAMLIKDKYPFRTRGADRYQIINGWLQGRLAPEIPS